MLMVYLVISEKSQPNDFAETLEFLVWKIKLKRSIVICPLYKLGWLEFDLYQVTKF